MTLPFSVIVITDWQLGSARLLERVELALGAGPGLAVQHRHPGVGDRQFFDEASALAALCRRARAPLFINGRLDVALALGAHLHCTSRSLPPAAVRPHLSGRWISCAVHGPGDDATAADLALVSPVFPPGSKPADIRPALGAEGFARLAATLPCPAFALGGVDGQNAGQLGAAGVAVITSVLHADDPRAAARTLLAARPC